MQYASLDCIVRERFGSHRGDYNIASGIPENSLRAIKSAIDREVIFVEFDVCHVGGIIRMGHPPQTPRNTLESIIGLFEEVRSYPKIDIKLSDKGVEPAVKMLDLVLNIVRKRNLSFVLITISQGGRSAQEVMETDIYFASLVVSNPSIKLDINPARYRSQGSEIGDEVDQHVQKLKSVLHSISAEIHKEDMEAVAHFASRNSVDSVVFYLKGLPDVKNSQIQEKTIRKALELEERYPIKVFFDINPSCIKRN